MPPLQLTLGEQLRRIRRSRSNLTLARAASLAGLQKTTLMRIERDQRDPQLATLIGIARAYGVVFTIRPEGVFIRAMEEDDG